MPISVTITRFSTIDFAVARWIEHKYSPVGPTANAFRHFTALGKLDHAFFAERQAAGGDSAHAPSLN